MMQKMTLKRAGSRVMPLSQVMKRRMRRQLRRGEPARKNSRLKEAS